MMLEHLAFVGSKVPGQERGSSWVCVDNFQYLQVWTSCQPCGGAMGMVTVGCLQRGGPSEGEMAGGVGLLNVVAVLLKK